MLRDDTVPASYRLNTEYLKPRDTMQLFVQLFAATVDEHQLNTE